MKNPIPDKWTALDFTFELEPFCLICCPLGYPSLFTVLTFNLYNDDADTSPSSRSALQVTGAPPRLTGRQVCLIPLRADLPKHPAHTMSGISTLIISMRS